MIAYLRGKVLHKGSDSVVVDVGGVGYEVVMDRLSLSELDGEGATVGLYVRTVVREDAITLYAFPDLVRREVFDHLVKVAGIGPRLAIQILGGRNIGELVRAVRQKDIRALEALPGVGKKLAERLVLELSEKFRALQIPTRDEKEGERLRDVRSALLNLGFGPREVDAAVRALSPVEGEGLEELIRRAIALITQG